MILLEFWLSYLYMDYDTRVKFIYNNYSKINLNNLSIFVSALIIGAIFIDVINLYRLWLTMFSIHLLLVFIISIINNNKYFKIIKKEREEEKLKREEQDKINREYEREQQRKMYEEYEEQQRKIQEDFIKYFFNNYKQTNNFNYNVKILYDNNITRLLKILELPNNIRDFNLVNKQYRKLVKLYHPDIYNDNGLKMKEINNAFDELKKLLKY